MPLQYLKNPETQQMEFYDTDTKRWISDVNPLVGNFIKNQNIPQRSYNPWDQIATMTQGQPELQFQSNLGTEQDFDILKGTTNSPFNTPSAQNQEAPTSLEELDRMVKSGQLTDMNLINQYELQLSNQPQSQPQEAELNPNTPGTGIPGGDVSTTNTASNPYNQRPWWSSAMNFAGSDLSTEAYSLGMRLGQERGTPGRGLGIVSSAGAFTLGAARDVLAGLSTQKMNNYISDWYKKNKQRVNYTADSQTQDNNYLGGQPYRKGGYVESMQNGGTTNPYYKEQLTIYNQYNNPANFSARGETRVIEGPELDKWYNKQLSDMGEVALQSGSDFVGGYKPIKVTIDAYGNYYPTYDKPSKTIIQNNPNSSQLPTTQKIGRFLNPNTGEPLPIDIYGSPGQADRPLSQGASLSSMTLENRQKAADFEDKVKRHKEALNKLTPEQRKQFKESGLTMDEFLITLDNSTASMQDGGNVVGYRMPLDGSQLPQNKQAANALFPGQYGDINFFAEAYNNLKSQMEQAAASEPFFVDADGNLIPRSVDPNNLSSPYVSMQESRRQARDLNRRIRQNDLPYQKVQKDAFYNPNGTNAVPNFKTGGEYKKGQYVEFMYGGEKISGVFDRLENGKIYLQ